MLAVVACVSLLSLLLGWFITLRLLGLARRTGAAPERILAIAFGSLACVGYPMAGLSRAPGLAGTPSGSVIFVAAMCAIVAGIISFGRFPALVFRPGVEWARALWMGIATLSLMGGLLSTAAMIDAQTPAELVEKIQLGALAIVTAIGIAFAWNAVESFLYYGRMKRRRVLGLADAVTTHRFLLWGLASAAGTLQILFVIVIRAAGSPILAPMPALLISIASLLTTTCWWLGFFMPDTYRERFVDPRDGSNLGASPAS